MTDYVIVSRPTKAKVQTEAVALLKDGYTLQGGIAVAFDIGANELVFAQALVRERFKGD